MAKAKEMNSTGNNFARIKNPVSPMQRRILANNGYTPEFIASFTVGYNARSAYKFINDHNLKIDVRWNNKVYPQKGTKMDWRTLTIADLQEKGFMYETNTDGWWIFLVLGFALWIAIKNKDKF